MNRLMDFMMDYKPLMMMYFAGGVILYLFADLIWLRQGMLSSALLWQILLASILSAAYHQIFYRQDAEYRLSGGKRIVLHLLLTFVTMFLLGAFFHWFELEPSELLSFVLIFILVYAVLFLGFWIYYKAAWRKLNRQLERYKRQRDAAADSRKD